MRNQSQQAMLDGFFASIVDTAGLRREGARSPSFAGTGFAP